MQRKSNAQNPWVKVLNEQKPWGGYGVGSMLQAGDVNVFTLSHEYGCVAFLMAPLWDLLLGQESCYWMTEIYCYIRRELWFSVGFGYVSGFQNVACGSPGLPRSCLEASTRWEEAIKHIGHSLLLASSTAVLCSVLHIFSIWVFIRKKGSTVLKSLKIVVLLRIHNFHIKENSL